MDAAGQNCQATSSQHERHEFLIDRARVKGSTMQRPLAIAEPLLYFGRKEPAAKVGERLGAGCGYMRGPFVFRKRLSEGERIVVSAGKWAGKYGTVIEVVPESPGQQDDAVLCSPYVVRFDDDGRSRSAPTAMRKAAAS